MLSPAPGLTERNLSADESFSRAVVLANPDGAHIQINEHDEELDT